MDQLLSQPIVGINQYQIEDFSSIEQGGSD